MRKAVTGMVLAVLLPGSAAAAENLSYTFVEAGWAQSRMDDVFDEDEKLDGAYIRGSLALGDHAYVFGGWSRTDMDDRVGERRLGTELTLEQTELGVGYHMPMSDRVDFTADVAWVRMSLDGGLTVSFPYFPRPGVLPGSLTFQVDSDIKLGRGMLGLRAKPFTRTEAWIKGGYLDGSDFEGAWTGSVGGQISLTSTWGLVAEYQQTDDIGQITAGIRASF